MWFFLTLDNFKKWIFYTKSGYFVAKWGILNENVWFLEDKQGTYNYYFDVLYRKCLPDILWLWLCLTTIHFGFACRPSESEINSHGSSRMKFIPGIETFLHHSSYFVEEKPFLFGLNPVKISFSLLSWARSLFCWVKVLCERVTKTDPKGSINCK